MKLSRLSLKSVLMFPIIVLAHAVYPPKRFFTLVGISLSVLASIFLLKYGHNVASALALAPALPLFVYLIETFKVKK